MDNATSCHIETKVPQERLCCVLEGLHMRKSIPSDLLNTTSMCFPDPAIKTSLLHMEQLQAVFHYVLHCNTTAVQKCSTFTDTRCSKETLTENVMYTVFLIVVFFSKLMQQFILKESSVIDFCRQQVAGTSEVGWFELPVLEKKTLEYVENV